MKTLIKAYKDVYSSYKDRALRMLGLTWFAGLISFLATVLLSGMLLLAFAVDYIVMTALAVIFLREYNKEKTSVEDVFAPFSDKEKLRRVVLGMAWMNLWILIWGLIPIAGIVFAVIKVYKYRFTPYILINEPDVPIMEAIKESERRTAGLRLNMFLSDLAAYSVLAVVCIILGLLSMIPYVGVVFAILLVICIIVGVAIIPVITKALTCVYFVNRQEYVELKTIPSEEKSETEPAAENTDTDVQPEVAEVETVYMDEVIASELAFKAERGISDETTDDEAVGESEPETADAAETETAEPETVEAETVEPVAAEEVKPAPKKRTSTARKPASADGAKPAAKKPAAKKPAAETPAAKKPATKSTAAKKTTAKK